MDWKLSVFWKVVDADARRLGGLKGKIALSMGARYKGPNSTANTIFFDDNPVAAIQIY